MGENHLAPLEGDALALRAARGDRAALEALLKSYTSLAVRIAFGVLGRQDQALDAAQETFIKVLRDLPSNWSGKHFRQWFSACAYHTAINYYRSEKRQTDREKHWANTTVRKEPETPEHKTERKEIFKRLRSELATMSEKTAAAIALHHLAGLSTVEISDQLGLSVDACRQRLSRGREELRKRLSASGLRFGLIPTMQLFDEWTTHAKDTSESIHLDALEAELNREFNMGPPNEKTEGNRVQQPALSQSASQLTTLAAGPNGQLPGLLVRSWRMIKTHPFITSSSIVALILFFIGLGTPGFWLGASEKAGGESDQPAKNSPIKITSNNPTGPSSLPEKVVSLEPRWHNPVYIKDVTWHPLSISAKGNQVVVLVKRTWPSKKEELGLYESSDQGRTWQFKEVANKYYSKGAVAIGRDSKTTILALPEGTPKVPNRLGPTSYGRNYKKLNWFISSTLTSPKEGRSESSWESPIGQNFQIARPRLLRVTGGHWAFAFMQDQDGKHGGKLGVARGEAMVCPKPLPVQWQGFGVNTPSAWAKDINHAGFVLTTKDKNLIHYSTKNGGTSWERKLIPFQGHENTSNAKLAMARPLELTRVGDRLTLQVWAQSKLADDQSIYQGFIMTSDDLGQSWSAAFSVPSANDPFGTNYWLHGTQSSLLGYNPLRKLINSRKVFLPGKGECTRSDLLMLANLRQSNDRGETWSPRSTIDNLITPSFTGNANSVVMGGDEKSLYLALYRSQDKCLVIKSFTHTTWKNDTSPGELKKKKLHSESESF